MGFYTTVFSVTGCDRARALFMDAADSGARRALCNESPPGGEARLAEGLSELQQVAESETGCEEFWGGKKRNTASRRCISVD
jgi:hypothetical protein